MTAGLLAVLGVLAYRVSPSPGVLRWCAVLAVISIGSALAWVTGNALYGEGVNPPVQRDGLVGALWVLRRSRGMLQTGALRHALPLVFPVLAIVVFVTRKNRIPDASRSAMLLLLSTILAARLRRGFEHVDWYHPLLEIPVYSMLLGMLWQQGAVSVRRLRWLAGLAATALAIAAYWNLGRGAFTKRGWFGPTMTARGAMRVPPGDGASYTRLREAIDRIDPTGSRPLFAFGYQGGFAYFMKRTNPTVLTQGFFFTALSSVDREWNRLASAVPPPILLDNPYPEFNESSQGAQRRWGWRGRPFRPIYSEIDRPQFDKLATRCRLSYMTEGRLRFRLFDCPSAAVPGAAR